MDQISLALSQFGGSPGAGIYRPFDFSNQGMNTNSLVPNQSFASASQMDQAGRNITDLNISDGNTFGFNMPTAQLGLQGLNTLAGLWSGMQGLKLAKDQLNFTKATTNTNLNNSINSYNTGLEDRLRTRAQFNGAPSDSWQSDFDRLKATR